MEFIIESGIRAFLLFSPLCCLFYGSLQVKVIHFSIVLKAKHSPKFGHVKSNDLFEVIYWFFLLFQLAQPWSGPRMGRLWALTASKLSTVFHCFRQLSGDLVQGRASCERWQLQSYPGWEIRKANISNLRTSLQTFAQFLTIYDSDTNVLPHPYWYETT